MSSLPQGPTFSRRRAVRLGSGGLAAALATSGLQPVQAADAATLEANKAIVRRLFEQAINDGNTAALTELYAPDWIDRGTWARQMPGPVGMPLTMDELHDLFPDVTVTIDGTIAEADLVATRATWRGSHPPAGTHVVGRTMHLFRLARGQIVEQWSVGWEWLAPSLQRSSPPPGSPLVVDR